MTAIPHLAPPDHYDPVIEEYKKHIDVSLLRANLRLSIDERIEKAARAIEAVEQLRGIAKLEAVAEQKLRETPDDAAESS